MNAKPEPKPDGAFLDAAAPPAEDDLKRALGRAAVALEQMLDAFRAERPLLACEWKFHARVGWHQIGLLKKRRIFYLLPKRGDFHLRIILGHKARAALAAGPRATAVRRLLKAAQRYPERTLLEFTGKDFDARLVLAVLAAKVAH